LHGAAAFKGENVKNEGQIVLYNICVLKLFIAKFINNIKTDDISRGCINQSNLRDQAAADNKKACCNVLTD